MSQNYLLLCYTGESFRFWGVSVLLEKRPQQITSQEFKQIFDSHYPALCRLLTGILGNHSAAEDVAQEAFIRLYETPPREFGNVKGWLAKVGSNLAFNYLRSEKSRFLRESRIPPSPPGPDPDDTVLRKEEIALTRSVLGKLAERDRLILLLKFSGYSYAEIAHVMELAESSVGTVLARARARFKAEYIRLKGSDYHVL